MKRVRYSTWLRDFKPTTNSLAQRAPFGGTMYETYGDELEEIREAADDYVWTLVDADGKLYVESGFHYVNRLGYFITQKPHTQETTVIGV